MKISLKSKIYFSVGIVLGVIFLVSVKSFATVPLVEIGKVENSYKRGKSTIVSIKVNTKLPIATVVYISKEFPATVEQMYHEEEGFYFYEAEIAGKGEVKPEEIVYAIGERKGIEVYLRLEKEREIFIPKKEGKVISAYKERVHIDRGSLHEVKERDIYAIYGADGKRKAKIEASGIGDREAIGNIFSQKKIKIEPGDRIVHLGQRKYFGLGISYVYEPRKRSQEEKEQGFEKAIFLEGGGLLWQWVFPGGIGFQWLWGMFNGNYEDPAGYGGTSYIYYPDRTVTKFEQKDKRMDLFYSFPFWLKWNLFYPKWFSPYLGVGASFFSGSFTNTHIIEYYTTYKDPLRGGESSRQILADDEGKTGTALSLFPVIGLELFPSELFHFFFDAKYFASPEIVGKKEKHRYRDWVFTTGITTNW